jgi:predicted RecA/RadA family phage recombinase
VELMAFEGGPLSVIGITPEFITGLATQTASSGVTQAIGQVWQGAGQSFFGSAGQALGGALAGSAVNIALNSAFGTNVPGPQGLSLNSGANILASTLTPYVTGAVAGGINQQIQQSLKNAGPFGPILSNLGTGLVNQALGGITNAITGATSPGSGTNVKMWPGGGMDGIAEPEAEYGDRSYTLTDIVFSLRRANAGPQQDGDAQALNDPKVSTLLPSDELTSMPLATGNPVVNGMKEVSMGQNGVKPGSLYDASRWTTPVKAGSLYDPGRWVGGTNVKLFP